VRLGAVQRCDAVDRKAVRATFEERFTVERMTNDYLAIYRDLQGMQEDATRLRGVAGERLSLPAVV
jgi:hypothetical protein